MASHATIVDAMCAVQNPHMASSSKSFHYYSFNFGCAPAHARLLASFAVPHYDRRTCLLLPCSLSASMAACGISS